MCVVKQSRKFVFTDRKIERLSADLLCGRKQLEFADERNAGLRVMLYKSGKNTFVARYNYLGKRYSMGLGEFPAFFTGLYTKDLQGPFYFLQSIFPFELDIFEDR